MKNIDLTIMRKVDLIRSTNNMIRYTNKLMKSRGCCTTHASYSEATLRNKSRDYVEECFERAWDWLREEIRYYYGNHMPLPFDFDTKALDDLHKDVNDEQENVWQNYKSLLTTREAYLYEEICNHINASGLLFDETEITIDDIAVKINSDENINISLKNCFGGVINYYHKHSWTETDKEPVDEINFGTIGAEDSDGGYVYAAARGDLDNPDKATVGGTTLNISGGTISINCSAIAAKGIKCAGDMFITDDPVINITTSGKGAWDEDDLETKAACGLSADGDINISGGTLTLVATGSGGKGMKCDSVLTVSGGDITVTTSGGLYYNNGTTENTNYTGNTDRISSDYYSSPKGIKAGVKTQVGNSYTYGGGMVISGGKIKVTTSGYNGEGIESKNYLNISGGEIYVDTYDDGINSAQNLTITGGYVYSRSNNNDGIDANGNVYLNGGLVYAIGSRSPELGIDANSEEGKKVFINGGTVIAVGGVENGSSISQATYRSSSVSSNTWYALTYGDEAIAFYVPQVSTGGGPGGGGHGPGGGNSSGLVISVPTTPTLKSGVTASGTGIFENNCYLNATVSGGTAVSLTHIGGTVGIDSVEPEQTSGDPRVFTLDGRYLGTEVPANFRGAYIQNGKKHIKLY